MHQQIRLRLGAMSGNDGAGAMAAISTESDPIEVRKNLLDLLDELEAGGYDILMAGGHDIETTGEFIFAVEDDRTASCAQLLKDKHFSGVRVIRPTHGHARRGPGGLAAAIRAMNLGGRRIHELFVGAEESEGIPIHVTTLAGRPGDATAS